MTKVIQLIEGMESGIYDFTVDGKCSGCGACCSRWLPVSDTEIKTIRRYMKNHKTPEQKHIPPTAKPVLDATCPFRSEIEGKCLIYSVRPAICRDFQCDKPAKKIRADRALYQGKFMVCDMRRVFYGREKA